MTMPILMYDPDIRLQGIKNLLYDSHPYDRISGC